MDRTLWPSNLPEVFREAAGALLAEHESHEEAAERLRQGLGLAQCLSLVDDGLAEAMNALSQDPSELESVALNVALTVGRQLVHQYPMSSLAWDAVNDELADVFTTFGFLRVAGGVWNRPQRGRVVVIQVQESVTLEADVRRLTFRWGVTLPGVSFCRHDGAHRLSCCAVSGGMGSVREPHGEHALVLTMGLVLEQLAGRPLRLVGREGFRARLHRLVNFCERVAERDRLVELVNGQPWRSGIGIAEQLRNANPSQLDELLS